MSILEAYWPQAKSEIGKILIDDYYGFDSDFIIRTALMLYGDVVKSTINRGLATQLKDNWNNFKKALSNLSIFLRSEKIKVSRFISGWNVLLPIIYVIYYNPNDYSQYFNEFRAYLIRAIFFGYFNFGTTAKLQQMKSDINTFNGVITFDLLNQRTELALTQGKLDDLLMVEKGSRITGEILFYLSKEWMNLSALYNYEQDHLHPEERFNESKPLGITSEDWTRWKSLKNKLPNLQYFEGVANASKSDMSLEEYLMQMNVEQQNEFKEHAIIPENVDLSFDKFEEFYNARAKLIIEKIKKLMN